MSWTDLPHLIASLGGYVVLGLVGLGLGVGLVIRWLRRPPK